MAKINRRMKKILAHRCYWRKLADELNEELYKKELAASASGLRQSSDLNNMLDAKLEQYARWYTMDDGIAAAKRAVLRIEYGA